MYVSARSGGVPLGFILKGFSRKIGTSNASKQGRQLQPEAGYEY